MLCLKGAGTPPGFLPDATQHDTTQHNPIRNNFTKHEQPLLPVASKASREPLGCQRIRQQPMMSPTFSSAIFSASMSMMRPAQVSNP